VEKTKKPVIRYECFYVKDLKVEEDVVYLLINGEKKPIECLAQVGNAKKLQGSGKIGVDSQGNVHSTTQKGLQKVSQMQPMKIVTEIMRRKMVNGEAILPFVAVFTDERVTQILTGGDIGNSQYRKRMNKHMKDVEGFEDTLSYANTPTPFDVSERRDIKHGYLSKSKISVKAVQDDDEDEDDLLLPPVNPNDPSMCFIRDFSKTLAGRISALTALLHQELDLRKEAEYKKQIDHMTSVLKSLPTERSTQETREEVVSQIKRNMSILERFSKMLTGPNPQFLTRLGNLWCLEVVQYQRKAFVFEEVGEEVDEVAEVAEVAVKVPAKKVTKKAEKVLAKQARKAKKASEKAFFEQLKDESQMVIDQEIFTKEMALAYVNSAIVRHNFTLKEREYLRASVEQSWTLGEKNEEAIEEAVRVVDEVSEDEVESPRKKSKKACTSKTSSKFAGKKERGGRGGR